MNGARERALGFEFATASRILFGAGKVAEVPGEVKALGLSRVLFVTGRSGARAEPLARALADRGIDAVPLRVAAEPTIEVVREAVERARADGCQGVVAVGGGSALDCGKAVAGLLGNGAADPLEHLEVVGRGRPLERPALPLVAVPTTAGTGSEVTRNAVVGAEGTKASLRSPLLLARLAVVDPDLLTGAPREVLVGSGLDALSQLVEPYLSLRANPLTDGFAAEGIRRSARSLRPAVLEELTAPRREDLALASLFGGLCLANAGLGAVHAFAGPAGAALGAPHGALCAALLAPSLTVNLRALRTRAPTAPAVARFGDLAHWLTGSPEASAEDGIAFLARLCRDLGVVGLGALGLASGGVGDLIERARAASSMKPNPIVLTDAELHEIVERAI
ncbi:MAG TPA: iron-containing alcohol dehydrogenase [Anaeromyxobacter sp.]|nr:iron-containing alcohol dehydrogenase [Anaeromyxobacter sp.]